jgi:hypothetical protein
MPRGVGAHTSHVSRVPTTTSSLWTCQLRSHLTPPQTSSAWVLQGLRCAMPRTAKRLATAPFIDGVEAATQLGQLGLGRLQLGHQLLHIGRLATGLLRRSLRG